MISPIAPKIPTQLPVWDEEIDDPLEMNRVTVSGLGVGGIAHVSIDTARLDHVDFTGLDLYRLEMNDAVCGQLEAVALRAYKAQLLRVQWHDCRMTGAEYAEANFEDCTFKNVKFNEAGFRFATFKRVQFEHCMFRAADFGNAKLVHVTFAGCDLTDANFASAHCSNVDITAQDIAVAKGILGLKGATISSEQLMQLAPLLASEIGFKIL